MFCDRIALMRKGRVVEVGRPGEVLTAQRISEVFGVEAEVDQLGRGFCNIRFVSRRRAERERERGLRVAG
ncbi:hypothetical protein D9M70_468610 [compost metagenome]